MADTGTFSNSNLWALAPWEIEVALRTARRMLHAVDPTFPLNPGEPFDVAAEVQCVRTATMPLARRGTPWAENEWLTFLHKDPGSDDPFLVDQWKELMALMDADATIPVTDDLGAQAGAMETLLSHALTVEQMFEAMRQAREYCDANQSLATDVGDSIPSVDGRKYRAAQTVVSTLQWHLHEYYIGPDAEEWEQWLR